MARWELELLCTLTLQGLEWAAHARFSQQLMNLAACVRTRGEQRGSKNTPHNIVSIRRRRGRDKFDAGSWLTSCPLFRSLSVYRLYPHAEKVMLIGRLFEIFNPQQLLHRYFC